MIASSPISLLWGGQIMKATPKGNRLHIGLFGRRNVGKSSLLNALTRQQASIVSEVAGTTTDPVEKPMELLPIGPVLFIDTAGIDDLGALGGIRVQRTRQVFDRSDLGIVVVEAGEWSEFEEGILAELLSRRVPPLVVFNKVDLRPPPPEALEDLRSRGIPWVETVANRSLGILELREAIIRFLPDEYLNAPSLLGDLIAAGQVVILVVPIDLEAPKGRLILPQVQAIRDLLDHDALCVVVKERDLPAALDRLRTPPALVVTDSQAFAEVAAATPPDVLLTSFSILFARYKGDLPELVRGALALEELVPGDRILIAEACTHHPIGDDIGRVKIPRWLSQYVGGGLECDQVSGHDFPGDLRPYRLVIHCGACMLNRREMLSRILRCQRANVPITNYGLTIAYSLGIFERALSPFPEALAVYRQFAGSGKAGRGIEVQGEERGGPGIR